MRCVPQEVVHSMWSRLFCGPLKTASRTPGALFCRRMSIPYRRSLFFTPNAVQNASRTPRSLFEHGTHIPYHRRPSPVPNVRHRGRLPPQRRRLPCLRRDNQVINLIEVRSFRGAPFLCLLISERGLFLVPSAVEGAGEGYAAAEPGTQRAF